MVASVTVIVILGLCIANHQIRNCIDAQNSALRNKFEQMESRRVRSDDTALLLPIRGVSRD